MRVWNWQLALLLYFTFNAGGVAFYFLMNRTDDPSWPRRGELQGALRDLGLLCIGFVLIAIVAIIEDEIFPHVKRLSQYIWGRYNLWKAEREPLPQPLAEGVVASFVNATAGPVATPIAEARAGKQRRKRKHHYAR